MILVYIAGPYSTDPVGNTRRALDVAHTFRCRGIAPIVPHLSLLTDLVYPMDYEQYLVEDLEIVRRCDAVYRLTGPSVGADREVAHAMQHEIPIWFEDTPKTVGLTATEATEWAAQAIAETLS